MISHLTHNLTLGRLVGLVVVLYLTVDAFSRCAALFDNKFASLSPLTFYRLLGRLFGLGTTLGGAIWFRSLGVIVVEDDPMMGLWMAMAVLARMLSTVCSILFLVHVAGFVEDMILLNSKEPGKIINEAENRTFGVGCVGKNVRAFHELIYRFWYQHEGDDDVEIYDSHPSWF